MKPKGGTVSDPFKNALKKSRRRKRDREEEEEETDEEERRVSEYVLTPFLFLFC